MTKPADIIFQGEQMLKSVEVTMSRYEVGDEMQEGDVFLRSDEGKYSEEYVFRRLVPLTEEEQALVQAGINHGTYQARSTAK